jgi:DNA-binding NarL/FixJ family response regulator/class 3 adenylate cyclase
VPTTTILFTDVTASSAALARAGDEKGVARITQHLRSARETVERHGGTVTKTVGDGVMALFGSALEGVNAAIALQQAAELAARAGEDDVGLRVGIHVGDVIKEEIVERGDVFGSAVVVARRLCDAADAGQILVSELVLMLTAGREVAFRPLGERELKGLPSTTSVNEVAWEPLPETRPLRVVLAEDAALIRAGLVRVLTDEGFDVVADVDDHDALVEVASRERPDIVITDIRMPPTHTDEGLRAAASLRAERPDLPVLVLSQHVEPSAAVTLLANGARGIGYMLKERVSEVDELISACRSLVEGGTSIDPLVAAQLVEPAPDDGLDRLTGREREVLELMAQGRSNRAIATTLFCSDKTVETHVRSIFTKLDLPEHADDHRRVTAVVRWLHARR